MALHASASLPQIQPIPPRLPPATEVEQYRKEARFRNVMNVADRPNAAFQITGRDARKPSSGVPNVSRPHRSEVPAHWAAGRLPSAIKHVTAWSPTRKRAACAPTRSSPRRSKRRSEEPRPPLRKPGTKSEEILLPTP